MEPVGADEFAARIEALGPFEQPPRLAVAASGGADSTALAWLADAWTRSRGGETWALIVDHGLRPGSAGEAAVAARRLRAHGIRADVLRLDDLIPGAGLAERARAARYDVLTRACVSAGVLHLLLGHHAADQAETVAMRMLAGSHPTGLAGMAALSETPELRLLRPLLDVAPARLRATLVRAGLDWIEDPSNADPMAQRARLRLLRRDRDGRGPVTSAMVDAARWRGRARALTEAADAQTMAREVRLHPEGYAVLATRRLPPRIIGALIQGLSGADHPPSRHALETLAAGTSPATLGGIRLVCGGRHAGPGGWILVREAAAMQPPVPAATGAVWDRRFRVRSATAAFTVGALGDAAAMLDRPTRRGLPATILASLPAFREGDVVRAIPHLGYPSRAVCAGFCVVFAPRQPAATTLFAGGFTRNQPVR